MNEPTHFYKSTHLFGDNVAFEVDAGRRNAETSLVRALSDELRLRFRFVDAFSHLEQGGYRAQYGVTFGRSRVTFGSSAGGLVFGKEGELNLGDGRTIRTAVDFLVAL